MVEQLFDTHKFLFTLNYKNSIKGHEVVFIDSNNNEKRIELEKIEIGSSPISCKLFDTHGNRYLVPFIRISRIFLKNELVWDNFSNNSKSNIKIIKGWK